MKKLLLFSGTTEGRALLRDLRALPFDVTACVATEYGKELQAEDLDDAHIHAGRMDEAAMERFLLKEKFDLVVDATHPYAVDVTANIRRASTACGVRRLRLLRAAGNEDGCLCVPDAAAAAKALCALAGNVLLTTGSKELDRYTAVPDYAARIYPRVLPSIDSVSRCLALGYAQKNILAMQGPFSQSLNEALIDQFQIKILVTKNGGAAGGFGEKVAAAANRGCTVVLIARPEDEGLSYAEVLRILKEEATS